MQPAFNPFEFEDVDAAEVHLRDPISGDPMFLDKDLPGDKKGPAVIVTLMGPSHPRRRELDFAIARRASKRMIEAMTKGRNAIDQSDPEEEEEQVIDKLAKYTLGWSVPFADDDGKPIEFSIAAARKIYGNRKLGWLREQLKQAADDRERFTRRSAAS